MAVTMPLNPSGTASVGVMFRKIDQGPVKKGETSHKFSVSRSLALRLFDNESTSDTLLHLRLPEMLYRVEAVVFAAAFGLSLFFSLSMPTSHSVHISYGLSLVAIISGIVSFVAYQTSDQLRTFKITETQQKAVEFTKSPMYTEGTMSNEEKQYREDYIRSGAFMNWDIDITAEATKFSDFYKQATRGSGGAFKKARLEVNIDFMRYAATMTAGPLVVFFLYNMVRDQHGPWLQSRGLDAMFVIVGTLCITFVKLISMDFQVPLDMWAAALNLLFLLGAGGLFFVVWMELLIAATDEVLENHIFFYLLVSGPAYAGAYLYVVIGRLLGGGSVREKCGFAPDSYANVALRNARGENLTSDKIEQAISDEDLKNRVRRDLSLDTTKHLLFVGIDIVTLGFLTYGFIFYAFGIPFTPMPFTLSDSAYPASPSPPPPHPFGPPSPPSS